jgi:hypothetical protein
MSADTSCFSAAVPGGSGAAAEKKGVMSEKN